MTPAQERAIVRGVRGRRLRRLVRKADDRSQRRFRAWLEAQEQPTEWSVRAALSDLYQESERLLDDLLRARIAR